MFCGWDWGSTVHAVCLIDDQGAVIKRWLVQHTEDQLMKLFCELAELVEGGDVAQVPVAIERGEGLVVGLIAGAGHPVWMVEPAAFKAARPRWGLAGAKSDLGDAFMLADYARTDGHRLRRVEPVEQATRELAALVRARTALVEARTAAPNQLWAVLAEHWPGAAVVFQKLTSQIALAFLSDYPTPQAAALLGERRMGQFCRRQATAAASPRQSSSAGSCQREPARTEDPRISRPWLGRSDWAAQHRDHPSGTRPRQRARGSPQDDLAPDASPCCHGQPGSTDCGDRASA